MTHTNKAEWYAMPLAIVIAGGLIGGGLYLGLTKNPSAAVPAQQAAQGIGQPYSGDLAPVTSADHIRGNAKAKAIIVEYSDTECPFCKRFHATLEQVMAKYGASGDVAWVYRHFPIEQLHKKAWKEAEATECAAKIGGEEKFWAYIDRLFAVTTSNDGLPESELANIASFVGLDKTAFNSCLSSGETKAKVQAQFEGGAKAGVNGTPFNFVITKKGITAVGGAVQFTDLDKLLQSILK